MSKAIYISKQYQQLPVHDYGETAWEDAQLKSTDLIAFCEEIKQETGIEVSYVIDEGLVFLLSLKFDRDNVKLINTVNAYVKKCGLKTRKQGRALKSIKVTVSAPLGY